MNAVDTDTRERWELEDGPEVKTTTLGDWPPVAKPPAPPTTGDDSPGRVVDALRYAVAKIPSQRVAQILVNAAGTDPFYRENDDLARDIREYANSVSALPSDSCGS